MMNENGELTKSVAKTKNVFVYMGYDSCTKRKYTRETVKPAINAGNGLLTPSSLGGISYATTEAFEQGYFPELAKGCERQVCLSLKQGTIKETVQKVLSVNR